MDTPAVIDKAAQELLEEMLLRETRLLNCRDRWFMLKKADDLRDFANAARAYSASLDSIIAFLDNVNLPPAVAFTHEPPGSPQ